MGAPVDLANDLNLIGLMSDLTQCHIGTSSGTAQAPDRETGG
jgi:hypothetical protein